jgi:DNA mismatch repair ATPase MutS
MDEILRGTNSDDKRNGTIEVVKVIANKAIGAIATHDISVPDYKQSGYSYQQMF